jgi:hypothetical protein
VCPPDWINADIEDGSGVDLCVDISQGLPLETDSIDYATSHHALQQLDVYAALDALRELHRVLSAGGVLRLGLPDLDRAIDALRAQRQEYFWTWEWKSVTGNFVTQITDYGYTSTLLNFEFTKELLERAGFEAVRRADHGETTSSHEGIVELDNRPDESFFVEAFKGEPTLAPAEPGPPRQVHLGWHLDPSTTLDAVWHTPSDRNPARVEYRPRGADTWSKTDGTTLRSPGNGFLHRVHLAELRPDTSYEYRVSSDEGIAPATSEIFETRTAPPPGPAEFRFAFACDTGVAGRPGGKTSRTTRVIEALAADRPLFVLGGGDYACSRGDRRFQEVGDAADAWFDQMEPLIARAPFLPQYGKHEVSLGEKFRDWAPRFTHPNGFGDARSYSFDVGDAHFTALFVPEGLPGAEQVAWLEADLADARARDIRWLIVFQHQSIFASGRGHANHPRLAQLIGPIFERHRVDLHLSGGDLSYERSYPLLGLANEQIVASLSADNYAAGQGVIYAKVSPAGRCSDNPDDASRVRRKPPRTIAVYEDAAYHYALVDVHPRGELAMQVFQIRDDAGPPKCIDAFRIVDRGREETR